MLCFLVIRGLPALLLYRKQLDRRSRVALALFSATELPLVVAITTIAVERGEMSSGTRRLAGRCGRALDGGAAR